MMIELIVTCALATASTFAPPQGWTVTEVRAYDPSALCDGSSCFAINMPDSEVPTTVTLKRQAKEGEQIELPQGCKVMAESKP